MKSEMKKKNPKYHPASPKKPEYPQKWKVKRLNVETNFV